MRNLFSFLASLRLSVILIVGIALVLAAGTILESMKGTEAARAVYYAPWFFALQGLFGVNLLCALIDRWPRNRWRIGFAVTHVSMLVILLGSLVTALVKKEGRIAIWEGQESNAVMQEPGPGGAARQITLPFAIRLDDFQIDVYPGTRRPAMFRSKVQVVDPAKGAPVPAVIEMNKPLSWGGFTFFQSSYQIEGGREMTVLSVSKDPGQPIVFLGYVLLVGGMIIVFTTRILQAKQAARPVEIPGGLPSLPVRLVVLGLLAAAGSASAVTVPDAATVEKLRALPVQHDGRTMPFDTQAREAVRTVTGGTSIWGLDPVAIVAGWAFAPNEWQSYDIVKVGGADVAAAVGLPPGTRWASMARLLASPSLRPAIEAAQAKESAEQKLTKTEKNVIQLSERVMTLYGYFTREAILPVPVDDPKGAWQRVRVSSAAELAAVGEQVRAQGAPAHYPDAGAMQREITYNEVRPTRIAWLLLLPAALAAGFTVSADRFRMRIPGALLLVASFAVMTWGIATRWKIAGRIPAANMYESMLFLAWGVTLFGVIALLLRQRLLVANGAAMGALAVLLCDLLPMDPFIHPIMPVLAGTPWLAIHVPPVVVSYSVFAMVTALAHLVIGTWILAPHRRDLVQRFSQLLYWYIHVGSILLIVGILTGSIWAASSWGRYWGWDPKEVWSLIAFLAYMAILHARFDEQIRDFGVAVASIAAFWTILMTYLGVNFILASGLHSYGFGSSNLVLVLGAVAAVEVAFIAIGWGAFRRINAAAR